MTEILAPAGGMEALRAAVANGANAVYLGGKSFSARAFADNFTLEEIGDAVREAHFRGVKVHIAVNTLAADEELPALLFYVSELYKRGVDAVIIQDLGLMELLHRAIPELPLHASTQMTVCSAALTPWLGEAGVERVILPREFSFSDMRRFKDASSLQVETFVHGALCVCYSGQCLFSSMVGGRSGNRGRCAQPCRLAYQLTDEYGDKVETKVEGEHLLSPRDLFGYEQIKTLHAIGLDSWKIEGRMKKPQYVATVSRIYSRLAQAMDQGLDPECNDEELRQLTQVFNRDHNSGYWLGNPGASLMSYSRPNNRGVFLGRILENDGRFLTLKLSQALHKGDGIEIWVSGRREGCTIEQLYCNQEPVTELAAGALAQIPFLPCRPGDRVFKTYDAPLMEGAELSYSRLPDKPLQFEIYAVIGEKLRITAYDDDGYRAEKESHYVVEAAKGEQKPRLIAMAQLGRLGGTGYTLGSLRGELAANALLPTSVLNHLRRELVDSILAQRRELDTGRHFDQARFSAVVRVAEPSGRLEKNALLPETVVLVQDPEQALDAAGRGVHDIYFDAIGWAGRAKVDWLLLNQRLAQRGARLIPSLPRIILPTQEEAWRKAALDWQQVGIQTLLINNLSQAPMLRQAGWEGSFCGGWGLNVFNSPTCAYLHNRGFERLTVSPELTLDQLEKLDSNGCQLEMMAQGPAELMVSEYCLLGAALGNRDRVQGQLLPCTRPCRHNNGYFLRDEKGYSFPIRCDNQCRMHIFNSRELCLLSDLPALAQRHIRRVILDLRLYDNQHAQRLVELYRDASADLYSFEEAQRRLPSLVKEYTKGHLNRGV